jgi:cyclohexanone monooxygenase
MVKKNTVTGANVDLDTIRAKYEAERAKRLNAAGTDQYTFTEGDFAKFADDPYADAPEPREPVEEDVDVLVIGAGIGGIQLGATLRRNHIDNFRIVDIAADFGGTWYWNRYPGLRCDVESYIYLPMLEETGFIPSERYVRGSEIAGYLRDLARRFELDKRALLQTKVIGLAWDAEDARWIATTSRRDVIRARFVTTQSGIFSRPQLPGIPGLADFSGCAFHSARWNYDYTGGSSDSRLTKLADKRVAVIGTGTTALQIVPELAEASKSLIVFQRTPTAVGVRGNAPTDTDWFKSLQPGWQSERIRSFNQLSNGENVDCPISDGWTDFFQRLVDAVAAIPGDELTMEKAGQAQEVADFAYNETIRDRVNALVSDPRKAELLKAYYRTMCKRPGFSDHYLQAFNKPNVDIVDVSCGIERITRDGIVVAGKEYPVDCIIFSTGFELGTTWTHQAGYEVIGRDGQRLSDKWNDGLITYHGLFTNGFPNIFFMGLTQTGITINVPHMLQEQASHLVHVIRHCLDNGLRTVEATVEAEQGWQDEMAVVSEMRRPFQEACTPGYYNAEGRVEDRRSAIGSGWYLPSTVFFDMWRNWREAGDFSGLTFNRE